MTNPHVNQVIPMVYYSKQETSRYGTLKERAIYPVGGDKESGPRYVCGMDDDILVDQWSPKFGPSWASYQLPL